MLVNKNHVCKVQNLFLGVYIILPLYINTFRFDFLIHIPLCAERNFFKECLLLLDMKFPIEMYFRKCSFPAMSNVLQTSKI